MVENEAESENAGVGGDPRGRGSSRPLTSFQTDLLAGAVMGGMVHTIVAPIERAKLLLQTQESNMAIVGGGRRRFRGMIDCIDLYRNIMRDSGDDGPPAISSAAINFIAGGAAGCTTLIIVYPLDIAHTRLAADVGHTGARQFKGIRHFLTTVHRKDGISGIYRGLPASLQGMVVHRSIYFGGFDTIKEILTKEAKLEIPLWERWMMAQLVTTSAGLVSYPLDTVRRRMMMQSGLGTPMYTSTLDCWKKIYRNEGFTSFYRGAMSNMFRSIGAAAILVLYDEVKKFIPQLEKRL